MIDSRIRIVDPKQSEPQVPPPSAIVGSGTIHAISAPLGSDEFTIYAVYFEPGSRFRPHQHDFDQVLYFEYGTGIVAIDGGDDVVVPTGQYVFLPANVVHMHGCTSDGPALQLSMFRDTHTRPENVHFPESWRQWLPAEGA